jgi:hypothetical protein
VKEFRMHIKMLDNTERTDEEYSAISKEFGKLIKYAALKHNIVLHSTEASVDAMVPKNAETKRVIELMAKLFNVMEGPYEN